MYTTQLAAVGIIDDLSGLGKDLKTLLTVIVLSVIYVASVSATWAATRSMLKAGVAAAGGAIVMGIIASQTVLTDKTAEELKKDHTVGHSLPVVRVADAPPPLLPVVVTPGTGRTGEHV